MVRKEKKIEEAILEEKEKMMNEGSEERRWQWDDGDGK